MEQNKPACRFYIEDNTVGIAYLPYYIGGIP
jgi:hypothetical protein